MFSQRSSVCRKEKRSRSLKTPRSREQFQSENEKEITSSPVSDWRWPTCTGQAESCWPDIALLTSFLEIWKKKKADKLFSFTRIFGNIPMKAETWGQVLDWMRGRGRGWTDHEPMVRGNDRLRADSGNLQPAVDLCRTSGADGQREVRLKWAENSDRWSVRQWFWNIRVVYPRGQSRGPLNNLQMTRWSWKLWTIPNILMLRRTQKLSWN